MYRTVVVISVLGAMSVAAHAGQVQIGAGPNGSLGLTAGYVGAGAGTFAERNYDSRLFGSVNATIPNLTPGAYSRTGGQSQSYLSDGQNYTALGGPNGVVFSMISDGCAAANCPAGSLSNNFWDGLGSGTPAGPIATTISIPVGQLGVTDVWTLMNDIWGQPSDPITGAIASNTSVTFNFGSSANATTYVDVVTVALQNAYSFSTSAAFGQIGSSVVCTSANGSNCNNYANGPLAPSTQLGTTVNGSAGAPVTVLAKQIPVQSYTSGMITGSAYGGSDGYLFLDEQGFLFGSQYSSLYLVNIQVTNNKGLNGISQTALSAITIDTAPGAAPTVPEPASFIIMAGGLAMVGISRIRRRSGRKNVTKE